MFSVKKVIISLVIIVGAFAIGFCTRGCSLNSDDELQSEIDRIENIVSKAADSQSRAMGFISEQYNRLEDSIAETRVIAEGIKLSSELSSETSTIITGVTTEQRTDRDRVIESAAIVDRATRIIDSLSKENYSIAE